MHADKVCIFSVSQISLLKPMSNLLDDLPFRQRKPLRISTDVPLFMGYSSEPSSSSSGPTSQSISSFGSTPGRDNLRGSLHVLCLHDFESSDPVHLPFHRDEVLIIVEQEDSGWWAAMRPQGDRIGWIPSSFVSPLDRNKILEHPNETLWPYEWFSDHPLSAVHDPSVPASEDYTMLSCQLVTPTDLVLYKGFFDDRARSHDHESFSNLLHGGQSPGVGDINIHVPPTPESPPPSRRTPRAHIFQDSFLPESASQLTLPASPLLFDEGAHYQPRLCRTSDQISFPCLGIPVGLDDAVPELISDSLNMEGWPVILKSPATASQGRTSPDNSTHDQSLSFELPATLCLPRLDQGILDIKMLDPMIWGSDNLAERFCVSMHTLYATIRQHDCLDWVMGRRSTDVTELQQFLDIHNHIASWVHKSVLAYDDMTQQTATLDFWIRVAEKCYSLRNFDSLCAIILALSESSTSLGSVWAQCTRRQSFAMLRNVLDISNRFRGLVDTMNSAEGPSVPLVRSYLDNIKELRIGHPSNLSHRLGCAADVDSLAALRRMQFVAVSNMLRHQSLPYTFKTARSISGSIEDDRSTSESFSRSATSHS